MRTRGMGAREQGWARSVVRLSLFMLVLASWSCSGKKRPFATGTIEPLSAEDALGDGASLSEGDEPSTPAPIGPAAEMLAGMLPIDEGMGSSKMECGTGACPPPCQGCVIGDDCVAVGLSNPSNACQVCDPARDAQAWSNDDGIECDDGLFCTEADHCNAGSCSGTARSCDDGIGCNGLSECDEATDACSPGINQCETGFLCDATSGDCVSTCDGCNIDGVCVANGAEQAGNPCLACDIGLSTTSFSPAAGKLCGAARTACSAQDTCDSSGVCQPNHGAAGSACGNPAASACNAADSCDGRGNCNPNVAANGLACDDGQFCSIGDECQGGVCVTSTPRDCGVLRSCDEASNQCRCSGCTIGGECVAPGTLSPSNPCQICDPARSQTGFSTKGDGAFCGVGEQCSSAGLCRFTGLGLLSAGGDTCVVRDGDVICVNAGQPLDIGTDAAVFQLASGSHHTCALLSNGEVHCWGDSLGSDRGQLGTANVSSRDGVIFSGTVQLGGRAVFLNAGTDYNCAILESGSVRCWGENDIGQLGYGHTRNIGDDAGDFPMIDVNLGGQRAIRVDAGNNHTCAVLENSTLRCWGRGFAGALGYGNTSDLLAPPTANVDVGAAVREVSTGGAHTCALLSTGFLNCWGDNSVGELGYGHTQNIGDDETPAQAASRTVPRDPAQPNGPTRPLGGSVDVGGSVLQIELSQPVRDGGVTCVRLAGGGVQCWGNGTFSGLGYAHRNNVGDNETPREAETITARRAADGSAILLGGNLALGGAATTLATGGEGCALRADGEVLCWRAPEQVPALVDF
jgi:hypothetical protein